MCVDDVAVKVPVRYCLSRHMMPLESRHEGWVQHALVDVASDI
jgi:hypothetical protein